MIKHSLFAAFCTFCLLGAAPVTRPAGHPVIARALTDLVLYNDMNEQSGVCGEIPRGNDAEIIEDRSGEWYLVESRADAQRGWTQSAGLAIPPDTPANPDKMSRAELEAFVNGEKLTSQTTFLVYTDLERQETHVFQGREGNWRLVRTFPCSTGKNASPTKRGLFAFETRGEWFYSRRLGSGAQYWIRFSGPYLYHSLAMNASREVIDETIGERVSSGCVRLRIEDARWLYENVPDTTAVLIW